MDTDDKAIRQTVRAYVEGMTLANEALLREAFHPQCNIIGHYEGALEWLSLDEFIEAINAEGAQDALPSWKIRTLNISGDAAAVKVTDKYAGMKFTDYLALLKLQDGWRIVNKVYYLQH
jgi:hypothetical protein